jgi:hypothetical protein
MKTQLLLRLFIVIVLLSSDIVSGQKIYLSPSGNDNNAGTLDKPLATLIAARNKAREFRKNIQSNQPVEIIALAGEYLMLQPLNIQGWRPGNRLGKSE